MITPTCFDSTDTLIGHLANQVAKVRDPRARHWLMMPTAGWNEALQQRIARTRGIASRTQTLQLRSVLELAASGDGSRPPFDRTRLVLAVAEALADPDLHPQAPAPPHAFTRPIGATALALATQAADALDLGLLCRPQAWHDGTLWQGDTAWLAALARHPQVVAALAGHLGQMTPGVFLSACQQWLASWAGRGGAPHLWLALHAGLPELLMHHTRVLANAAGERMHMACFTPSSSYWADSALKRERLRAGEDPDTLYPGALLHALGRQARDLHAEMVEFFECDGAGTDSVFAWDPDASLQVPTRLALLQAGAHRAEADSTRPIPLDQDASFSVHACRGPAREMEVARDLILAALAENPTWRPEECQVLLADPDTHAPLAEAAFPAALMPRRLQSRRSQKQGELAGFLLEILHALRNRFTAESLIHLLKHPLAARRFELDVPEIPWADWLLEANLRWGLNETHREREQHVADERWSLAFALRRLAAGAILPQRADPCVSGATAQPIVPLERAEGLNIRILARLADALAALTAYQPRFADTLAQPLSQWCATLQSLCTDLLDPETGGPALVRLQTQILPDLAATPSALPLSAAAFLRLFQEAMAPLNAPSGGGAGGVTLGDLHDFAGVPARITVIVGLGAAQFPHAENRPHWHPLERSRRKGDPSLREADRHALLMAILATRQRLALTWSARHLVDDAPQPASTPLLDVLEGMERIQGAPVVPVHHTLHGFAPAAFREGSAGRSMLPKDFAAANIIANGDTQPDTGLWRVLLDPSTSPLAPDAAALRRFLREPCGLFLRTLGLPSEAPATAWPEAELLTVNALQHWKFKTAILQHQLEKKDANTNLDLLQTRESAAGNLPPGMLGTRIWLQAAADLPDLSGLDLAGLSRPEPLRGTIGDLRLSGHVQDGWFRQGKAWLLLAVSRRKPAHELAFLLDTLLLVSSGQMQPGAPIRWFAANKSHNFTAPSQADAAATLGRLHALMALGACLPLPLWPVASGQFTPTPGLADIPDLCAKAFNKWQRDEFGNQTPEADQPATRQAFRSLDNPFVWQPDLRPAHLALLQQATGDATATLPLAATLGCAMARHRALLTGGTP